MFSSTSPEQLVGLLPQVVYTVPGVGEVDFTPYITAIILFVGLTLLFKVVQMVVVTRIHALSQKTNNNFDDVLADAIQGIRAWVYTLVALYIAIQPLAIPELVEKIFKGVFLFAIVWQGIEIAAKIIGYFTRKYIETDEDGDGVVDPNAATASDMVTLMSRIVLWALGILFVLSNLGIEVTSLIAGLGIGGIAIAFALQGILSDLFASFSIYFDKPFRVGDFVVLGSDSGTVERIGVKSTRLRTLQGEELVVSNAELTTARVQNFKKMAERRVVAQFGITYETEQSKLRDIPGMIDRIFTDIEKARLDRAHFSGFGDFALLFEVVYYVESSDYNEFMDIQQQYNLKLLERFAEVGIEFAYPTQVQYNKTVS